MRFIVTFILSLMLAASAQAGRRQGQEMQAEQYEELLTQAFKGKSPEYIAKYFVHPNGFCASYAMKAMKREHGKAAVGLLTRLLRDDNPTMRYSAVKVLGDILLPKPAKKSRKGKAPKQITPEAEQLIELIEPLADDKSPAVQQAVAQLFFGIGVDNEAIRRIAIKMADSPDLSVRNMALDFGRRIIKDPETCVKIGMTVSRHMNIPHMWAVAHMLIAAHKDSDVCRQGIPALANYLLNVGNTLPVRGMFSDGPQKAALIVLDAQWDAEVEKMNDTVPAVCCAFVRLPHVVYPGWMAARKTSLDILKKMSPAAAPAIRDYVKKERQWLKRADGALLGRISTGKNARGSMSTAVDYLEYIAECKAGGKPVTKKCPIQLEDAGPEIPKLEIPDLTM